MLYCPKCDGKIFLDRTGNNYGHLELFCLRCGKRWEAHKDTFEARTISRLERKRKLGYLVGRFTNSVLSEWQVA